MNVGVLGVYQSKFGELWERSWEDLLREAVKGCLDDARVELTGIEAIYVSSMLPVWQMGQNHLGAVVAEVLGVKMPVIAVEAACASGGVAVSEGVWAVASGRYEKVLVVGVEKMTDIGNGVVAEMLMGAASKGERESGITFPGLYAMLAREYMSEFGLSREQLAQVPVVSHQHGALNELAQFQFELSVEQVLGSSEVADPLRLFDCSGVTDGAAAVVLGKKNSGVRIVGSGQAQDSVSLMERASLLELAASRQAAEKACELAGIEAGSVGVAEVHDCFSSAGILAIEDVGLAGKGEGVEMIETGKASLGGACPVNTSGGLKACGHPVGATGVKQVVEIVRQLRGELGVRQVEGVKVGLAHNVGGSGGTAVVHLLTK